MLFLRKTFCLQDCPSPLPLHRTQQFSRDKQANELQAKSLKLLIMKAKLCLSLPFTLPLSVSSSALNPAIPLQNHSVSSAICSLARRFLKISALTSLWSFTLIFFYASKTLHFWIRRLKYHSTAPSKKLKLRMQCRVEEVLHYHTHYCSRCVLNKEEEMCSRCPNHNYWQRQGVVSHCIDVPQRGTDSDN